MKAREEREPKVATREYNGSAVTLKRVVKNDYLKFIVLNCHAFLANTEL